MLLNAIPMSSATASSTGHPISAQHIRISMFFRLRSLIPFDLYA